jgi:hypothetical protein
MRAARVSARRPPPCATPSEASGAWDLAVQPARVSPQPTPRVCSRASALGLWGTGNRVPSFPGYRRRGKAQGPLPRFRDGQPEHFSPDHSGSPNHHPRGPPRVGRGSGSSGGLSAAALPVECGASPHFLRHPASPVAQRMWGHALDPPAPAPTGKRFPSTLPRRFRRVKARPYRNLNKASHIATQRLQEKVFSPLTPPPPRATL